MPWITGLRLPEYLSLTLMTSPGWSAFGASTSKLKKELARILKEQGYIEGWEVEAPNAEHPGEIINVRLKYSGNRKPVIQGIQRVSRPGQRTYVDSRSMPKVLGGMGTSIISTSRGVMTGHDARRAGVGGEVVAEVW